MVDYFSPLLDDNALHQMSSLALAHVGDSVFEMLSRCYLATNGCATSKKLHKQTISIVSAKSQSKSAKILLPLLTEEEHAVFNRGRNSKPKTVPKSSTREEYALSTALEALFGYLYLKQEYDRINFLYHTIITHSFQEEKNEL